MATRQETAGRAWWGLQGPEYLAWLQEQPEVTYLMGAKTYRLMSGFAAGQTPEGTNEFSADEEASVGRLTGAAKVVFSSSQAARIRTYAASSSEVVGAPGRREQEPFLRVAVEWVSIQQRCVQMCRVRRRLAGPGGACRGLSTSRGSSSSPRSCI